MVRGPEIKLSPTILFDFWVLGELGPQKGAKKAIDRIILTATMVADRHHASKKTPKSPVDAVLHHHSPG